MRGILKCIVRGMSNRDSRVITHNCWHSQATCTQYPSKKRHEGKSGYYSRRTSRRKRKIILIMGGDT